MNKPKIRLDDLPKSNVFRTPERYFDELPMIIQSKTSKPSPEPVVWFSWTWRRTWLSLASASLIAVLVWLTLPPRQGTLGEETLSQVQNEEILNYLQDRNLSHLEIADQLINKEGSQLKLEVDSTMLNHLEVSDDEILQHLDPEEIKDII